MLTSLERARQFLKKSGKKLAITALPLAMAALPAHAGSLVFSASGASCLIGSANANTSGSCSQTTTSGQTNGANGLDLFSNGPATATALSGGGYSLSFDWFGGANGSSFSGTIPLTYDFFVTSASRSTFSYSLNYIGSGGTGGASGTFTPLGSPGFEVQGSTNVSFSGNTSVTGWEVILSVASTDIEGNFTVNVTDTGSVDVNGPTTPEPASWLLTGPAGAGLWLLRRRLIVAPPSADLT